MTEIIEDFEALKEKIKDIENFEIISEILDNIKSDKSKEDIINCINACTSPVNVKKGGDIKTIFNAFSLFPLEETRVLILGQDPYPSGKGTGYAFLLKQPVTENDSLYYILKAIKGSDFTPEFNGKEVEKRYKNWATKNKVLLLNTSLTHETTNKNIVKKHSIAWKPFIKQIIKNLISNEKENLIVYLWGVPAQDLFFQLLNECDGDIRKGILNDGNFPQNRKGKAGNKFKKGPCSIIKNPIGSSESKLKLYLYSHPSKLNDINDKPFDCHEHFKEKNINWQELLDIYG